jgi:glycosyltransferase involved in cell wall biosynthesis
VFDKVIHRLEIKVNEKVSIKCIDKMRRIKLLDLLSPSNWLLMTSISEGAPQVIKGALYCGLPGISFLVGNLKDRVDGAPNCSVSSSFDVEELPWLVWDCLSKQKGAIRNRFIGKHIYDNRYIAGRLAGFYQTP